MACAVVVRRLLPPSQRFVPAPTGVRALLRMSRRALSDRGLLALYAIGGCSAGALVAVFNTLGFRLSDAPFHLGPGRAASLVFLVYPVGSLSSVAFDGWPTATVGAPSCRWGACSPRPAHC